MPGYVTRFQDLVEYPVIKGFGGRDKITSVVVDPSVGPVAPDALNNYYMVEGTILCKNPADATKHVAFAGTAQVQSLAQATGTVTAGTFTLTDTNGNVTAPIAYNATGAQVASALNALPGSSGRYSATGAGLPGAPVSITSSGGGLGVSQTLTAQSAGLTGGTYAVTQTTAGQVIDGILGMQLRFFDATTVSSEAGPMFNSHCVFDTTRIPNYATYAAALKAALPTCRFE
jgi:hypothetical protein